LGAAALNHPVSAIAKTVMAGHSRPKDGVASLAYVPAITRVDVAWIWERSLANEV
jgi:hypothetical protein